MSEETNDVRERMQEVGRYISTILPPDTGFVFLAFGFKMTPGQSRMEYISNGRRADVVKAMREFIAKAGPEDNFGRHIKS